MAEQWELPLHEDDLTHLPGWQKFRTWVDSYGGNKIMQYCYKFSAPFAKRYRQYGRRVSFSLVWETVRDHMREIRRRAERRGIKVRHFDGYSLNNDLRSYAMRHIIARRPEWTGLFEMREQGRE